MSAAENWTRVTRVLAWLGHNRITALGAAITTAAGLTMVGFWTFEYFQLRTIHPYAGIILFLILPGVFAAGLLMMPLGALYTRWKSRGLAVVHLPEKFEWEKARHGLVLFGLATAANIVIMGTASYKSVEHMDSVEFCGKTCHSVMAPEYTAFIDSPHSRVACTACHIGPGAPWFVRSKLSGTRQLFAVAFETYSRPIPSPVKHLRPAQETCEQCHWPAKFHGDKFVVRTKFQADENNTKLTTVLVLRVGGGADKTSIGIHGRHLNPAQPINYVTTDEHRQVIAVVNHVNDKGESDEFVSTDIKVTPEQLEKGEHRRMDCMDCHNRPSHTFEMPERAVDRAMADGGIDPSLPFAKKKVVELLRVEYPDRETASQRIISGLTEYYRTTYPGTYAEHRALVENAANRASTIYLKNVFPSMKVGWGTYTNNIGHEDFLGCFRCHDENHKTKGGKAITQDCDTCHHILAMEESNPKVLADLGIK